MEAWTAEIPWDKIIRICFRVGDFLESDDLMIFINGREASYLIPIDGEGGVGVMGDYFPADQIDTS